MGDQGCIINKLNDLINRDVAVVRQQHVAAKRYNACLLNIENSLIVIDRLKEERNELVLNNSVSSSHVQRLKEMIEEVDAMIKRTKTDIDQYTAKHNAVNNELSFSTCTYPTDDDRLAIFQKQLGMHFLRLLTYSEEGSLADENDVPFLAQCFDEDAWKQFQIK